MIKPSQFSPPAFMFDLPSFPAGIVAIAGATQQPVQNHPYLWCRQRESVLFLPPGFHNQKPQRHKRKRLIMQACLHANFIIRKTGITLGSLEIVFDGMFNFDHTASSSRGVSEI